MILFWSLMTLMLIIALLFVLLPLFKKDSKSKQEQRDVNLSVHKDRLKELEQELALNLLDEQQFAEAKEELAAEVLADAKVIEKKNINYYKSNRVIALLLLCIIPIFTLSLYYKWGDSKALAKYYVMQQNAPLIKKELAKYKNPQQLIDKMEAILRQKPNSARGWFLLGRLYIATNQYEKAQTAFAKSNQLKPNQPGLILQYAQAIFFANNNHLTPKGLSLVQQVIKKEPNNPVAINLLALNAYNTGQYQSAVNYWQQLISYFPPESQDGKAVLAAIANAQKKTTPHDLKPTALIKIPVLVNLDKQLKSQLPKDATLFVYAKAEHGPPMPLAIVRQAATTFPIEITLSSNMAMLQSATLNDFNKVIIFARISKTGNAIPQKGDLSGQSVVLDIKGDIKFVQVNINKIL